MKGTGKIFKKKLVSKAIKKLADSVNLLETPLFVVKINGIDISKTHSVSALLINKSVNKIPYACLELNDGDVSKQTFSASSSPMFLVGTKVEVFLGQGVSLKPVFKGIIVKHAIQVRASATQLKLELKDIAVKLTALRRNRIFKDKTDTEIIKELINAHNTAELSNGLELAASETEVRHPEMVQYFCTDWDFLVTRAEANGQVVLVDNGKISVINPFEDDATSEKEIVFGSGIYEFEAEEDGRQEYGSVKANAWDDAERRVVSEESGNASVSLSDGQFLFKKFELQHHGQLKPNELKAWAEAKKGRSILAATKGRVKIDGDNTLRPGGILTLKNFSSNFNGDVYISSVTHLLSSASAYTTEIEFGLSQESFSRKYADITELPASGLLPPIHGLQTGIVKKITGDPDNNYRINVSLPLIGEGDGIWARLATLDAGNKRGSFFLPEVGDEVILGFMNDDPREPVILGMLYSRHEKGNPPIAAEENNYKKGFYTKGGIKLEFDDEKGTVLVHTPECELLITDKFGSEEKPAISISDGNNNSIEMNSDGIKIVSSGKLELSASGDITVKGKNIDQTASGLLKLKGSKGTNVSSDTADTVIKGQFVRIN